MKKKIRLDIPDMSHADCRTIRQLAKEQYGKPSISYLVTQHLNKLLKNNTPLYEQNTQPCKDNNNRVEIRLFHHEIQNLLASARSHHMTTNAFIGSIIRSHLNKTPLLTAAEAEALYQSNTQLLRIGRNLNQMARQLNSLEGGSITRKQVIALQKFIEAHAETVGELLLANRKRNDE